MTILGIETSCDETAVAVIEGDGQTVKLKANVVASSLPLHVKTGGIIPEIAAREQLHYILPVLKQAMDEAHLSFEQLDAIAVTYGPGLIGSLLVGVETARTLAFAYNLPIIPVNHMIGHVYANWITNETPIEFPALALIVSGGHTDLLLLKNHGEYQLIGGTRDDAAGEAFDKIARLIGSDAYPGGPAIEKAAKEGDPKRFRFPRPLLHSDDFDFSFSGLKTAVLREVQKICASSEVIAESRIQFSVNPRSLNKDSNNTTLDKQTINDLARGTQDAIIEVLVRKTLRAAETYNVKAILLSGGVAANQTLREAFQQMIADQGLQARFFAPAKNLCTDNAAMIASAAYFNPHPIPWQDLTADPELYFD